MSGEAQGRLVGKTHHFPIRVYYADTDAGGMVYHGTYLAFAEKARTEMMRLVGLSHVDLQRKHHIMLAVRHCVLDFRRPAYLDDLIEVRSTLTQVGGASMTVRQDVWRDDKDLARLDIRLACLGDNGRPARLERVLRGRFEEYVGEEAE